MSPTALTIISILGTFICGLIILVIQLLKSGKSAMKPINQNKRQKQINKKYDFVESAGYYKHKNKETRLCQYCLLKEYIESPLHVDMDSNKALLKCNTCDKLINNPDYKPPSTPKPKNLGEHGWMAS